jgi:hypothetical protein
MLKTTRPALRRRLFGAEVAGSDFVFRAKRGAKRKVRVRIGKPYEVSSVEWACPVEIRGFEPRYPDMRGVDSVQALCLALAAARARIEDFIDKGGRVLDVGDRSEWDRRALMAAFGATSRRRGRITGR